MKQKGILSVVVLAWLMVFSFNSSAWALIFGGGEKHAFTDEFMIEGCTFANTGSNPYFSLEIGHQLVLEGVEDKEDVKVEITVLDETESVGGVLTRVVEEREYKDGELAEVSRNFFAICVETNSVFYFGEDVDDYEDGVIIGHEGEWRAGIDGARAGIFMPGTILLGARFFQEIAPDIAMDRAEIQSIDEVVETVVGTFEGCLKTLETTPIEPNARDLKIFAPGIGLIVDEMLFLTDFTIP